ncbi:MAG: proton-conducting transporter membrane subunit [Hyphomicrobium sp.]|uniref:complex I subunit 5 family protein n=1 Tax=Hyphomicrobium sp. TaxID=82 RepID=UPI0039E69A50
MNEIGTILLALTMALPFAMLAMFASPLLRAHVTRFLWLGPLPALGASLVALGSGSLKLDVPAFGMTFLLDKPAAILLLAAALLWVGAEVAAARIAQGGTRFSVCWLLTMAGSFGVFIAADLLTFYLVYALVSIPAYGLIATDDHAESRRAAGVYMAFTILGEALLLLAFAALAAGDPAGSIMIHDVMAALPTSPWRDAALALTIAAFGLKIALVPGHGWMPLTYTAAPIPAAAVLSGAAVKAGVIGLIRFLPFDVAFPGWGAVLVALGFFSAFYGVAIGLTQHNPKTILAYSSISQMGVIAAVLGMSLSTADQGAPLDIAFYAAHHVLVKGALFLTIGAIAVAPSRHRQLVFVLAAIMALSLAGLPFTGGALAKIAVKAPLGDGIAGSLAALSSAATALLMLHFLACLSRSFPGGANAVADSGLDRPWLALTVASLVVPWLFYPAAGGRAADFLSFTAFWKALWPVALGAAGAAWLWTSGPRLPSIPAGDILQGQIAAFRASFAVSSFFEYLDLRLRQWPVASLSLLAIALLLTVATRASNSFTLMP